MTEPPEKLKMHDRKLPQVENILYDDITVPLQVESTRKIKTTLTRTKLNRRIHVDGIFFKDEEE